MMTLVWVVVALLALVFVVFFLGMRGKWSFVLSGVRRMNRRFMNPRQMRTAGSPGAFAGVIHHVGRVSGKAYATPVGPFPVEGGFVVNLPYGTSPDWVRNVLAAGRATLVVNGAAHELEAPEIVAVADIVDQLPAKERSTLRAFAVRQSLFMREPRPGPYYHGTRADLRPGDLIEPGYRSNFGSGRTANNVYFAATLDAAVWGAELAVGENPGRIYLVEPIGPFEDDPNLTDKKFPGNPTKSYRSRRPLRVTGEVPEWEGHAPDVLQAMKDMVERLRREGVEAIDD